MSCVYSTRHSLHELNSCPSSSIRRTLLLLRVSLGLNFSFFFSSLLLSSRFSLSLLLSTRFSLAPLFTFCASCALLSSSRFSLSLSSRLSCASCALLSSSRSYLSLLSSCSSRFFFSSRLSASFCFLPLCFPFLCLALYLSPQLVLLLLAALPLLLLETLAPPASYPHFLPLVPLAFHALRRCRPHMPI